MANSFADLKKNRGNNLDKLTEKMKKLNEPKEGFGDDRFWSPSVDKAGNGYAVFRFLPTPANEDYPWVSYFDHAFQGPTGLWYIENDLSSIGKDDPCSQYNTKLWNSGLESNKDQARKQKRRLHYVSNIFVISDPAKPENEGKTFLFKYGKKIFEKLNEAMNPQFEDETPINPFDLWEGANFKLKIRQVEGYRNYDKSEFDSAEPLSTNDKELEKIYNGLYSLAEFVSADNFKSYDELQAKLNKVMGLDEEPTKTREVAAPTKSRKSFDEDNELPAYTPPSVDTDEDEMDYFKSLADD